MLRFCVGCHSNRGIARVVARLREKLAHVQCEFVSHVILKQAAIALLNEWFRVLYVKPSSKHSCYTSHSLCYPWVVLYVNWQK